ncbi:MAG: nickel-dependent lactate racemase [Chloroflexota bacterium]|nr:nickel-dependent lactate racemase [Chloroflexota bacterium]
MTATQRITTLVSAFFGDNEIELWFPENWQIKECRMAGHDRTPLSDEEMRAALRNPIGAPPLQELAKGKKQVCILFDDLPKPTPASHIMPFVLEELHAGGISDEQIRFLCAPGAHRPLTRPELVAKLGEEIVRKYPIYNHSIWENLVYMGETSRGTPVHVNREFASCDLRVGVGGIIPHILAGFAGGAKLVMPGVCGIETIAHHHKNRRENAGRGIIEGNVFRLDLEEVARLAGLHFKVDAVLNNRREVVGLFAGDFVAEHRAGVELARQVYRTEVATDVDVVVTNSYPDESQPYRATWCVPLSLREGGDVVLLAYSLLGQTLHQWVGRFGTDYGGRGYDPGAQYTNLGKAGRVIVLSPYPSKYDQSQFGPSNKVTWCCSWGEALAQLAGKRGPGTKVAIYPCAPIQMIASA